MRCGVSALRAGSAGMHAVPSAAVVRRVQVSEKKAKQWCASKGNIPHLDVSAKDDINVEAAFAAIARAALRGDDGEEADFYVPDAVDVTSVATGRPHKSGCC